MRMGRALEIVGEHGLDILSVRRTDRAFLSQTSFSLGRFFGKDMAFIRFVMKDLFLRRDLEPLLGSLVCV